MDSLLDALTNVVGILLLVLVLTSLQMSKVVNKIISELQPVSEQQLQNAELERDTKEEVVNSLKTQIAEQDPDQLEAENKQLAAQIEEMDVAELIDTLEDEIRALRKKRNDEEDKKKELTTTVSQKDEELAQLKAQLDATPVVDGPKPELITLPDPREAPDRSEPRYVICKGGRLYYVGDCYKHLFAVRDYIDSQFINFVYQGPAMGTYYHTFSTTKKNEAGNWEPLRDRENRAFGKFRYDRDRILKHFTDNAATIGGRHFAYKLVPVGDRFSLRLIPRETGGWSIAEFNRLNSEFDLALKRIQGERDYLYFLVATDSFRVYTAARQRVEAYRIPAGWTLWDQEEFLPDPSVKRESTTIDLGSWIPVTQLRSHAERLKGALEKNAETAQAEVDAIPNAQLKEYAQSRYANSMKYNATNIARLADVASKFRNDEEVIISPQAPEIPHIRTFAPASVPKELPKPPDPNAKKKKGNQTPSRPVDILD